MNIQEIYNLAVKLGIKNDPRGEKRIEKILIREKERYKDLKPQEKEEYDQEKLRHPYSDTRILVGDPDQEVKRVLVGIDISVSEVLLADWLTKNKQKIDLIISHHPLGRALASLDDVISLQADLLAQYGVPINVAESLLEPRINELGRKLSPGNHYRTIDAAKIVNQSLICTHTVCDNLVYQFMDRFLEKNKPETVKDLVDLIKSIPEYQKATLKGLGPKIFAGKPERRCGKIALTEVTGGTAGSKYIYEKLSQVGIGTIVGMHMDEEYKEEAEKHHLNVVIAGHMASDSLGMNLFLDEIEKRGVEIIPCSGLIRVKRK